jgi:hypothetical protein
VSIDFLALLSILREVSVYLSLSTAQATATTTGNRPQEATATGNKPQEATAAGNRRTLADADDGKSIRKAFI